MKTQNERCDKNPIRGMTLENDKPVYIALSKYPNGKVRLSIVPEIKLNLFKSFTSSEKEIKGYFVQKGNAVLFVEQTGSDELKK